MTFHQFEEDRGEPDLWGMNNNYASASTVSPNGYYSTSSSRLRTPGNSSFTQRMRFLFNRIHSNNSPARYSWQRRQRWRDGGKRSDNVSMSDKEIGDYTLRASPTSPQITSNLNRR